MKKIFVSPSLLIALFILCLSVNYGQKVSIQLKNHKPGKAVLHSLSGEKMEKIDSVAIDEDGVIEFNASGKVMHEGIYRWTLGERKWLDFIYDSKDADLKTDVGNILDSMKAVGSNSNRLFYDFIKLNRAYKIKTELLQLILARYPKDDDYYKTTQIKINKLQDEYLDFVVNISQKEPASFIARYIRSGHLPVFNFNLPPEKQLAYLKAHALDNVDFKDASLINSDLFTNKTIEYLTYFRNPNLPKELLEKEFIAATDSILNRAKVHQLVYQHIVEYLINGFKTFGLDQVVDYIVQNYVIKDDLCLDTKTESAIQKRLDQARKLPAGSVVPNIILPDEKDNEADLSKIKTGHVLILFYASWCPHCQTLLPQMHELYKNQKEKKFEVVAVSLDSKKEEWLNFVKNNKLSWINVSDLKGWETKPAYDFYIYATPTMFLVDKERKIIAKPITFEEVRQSLSGI